MKKAFALFLALSVLVGCLCGCASPAPAADPANTNEATSNTSSGEKAKVNVFSFAVEFTDLMNELANLYMSTHDNVAVNVEIGTSEVLRTKMASGDAPTLFGIDGTQDVIDWYETLADLSDQAWLDTVYEGMTDAFVIDGKIMAAPAALQGYGFIYNKRIFEAAGIDASTLTSYDAIDSAFAKLQKMIDDGELADQFPQLEAVIETAAAEYWIYGKHTSNMAFSLEFGDSVTTLNAKEINFTYADALKELTDMQVRYTSSADHPEYLNAVDYSMQIVGGFAIERVAVVQEGTWIYTEVSAIDPEIAENMGLLPLPMKGAKEDCIACGTTGYAVNGKAAPADVQATKDYLCWLMTNPEAQALQLAAGLLLPVNTIDTTTVDPLNREMLDYLSRGKTVNWVFTSYPTGFAETMNNLFQGYLTGDLTWDDVVAQAKDDWAAKRA